MVQTNRQEAAISPFPSTTIIKLHYNTNTHTLLVAPHYNKRDILQRLPSFVLLHIFLGGPSPL